MSESYHTLTHKSTFGYVYLIKSDSGHYKIGKSKTPKTRISSFTLHLPFKVELLALIQCEDYTLGEKMFHRMHQRYHVNGEWFAMPEEMALNIVEEAHLFRTADSCREWLRMDQEELDRVMTFMEQCTKNLKSQGWYANEHLKYCNGWKAFLEVAK